MLILCLQYELQSDRDFERLLKEDRRQLQAEKKKKQEKRAKKMEICGKKGMWQDDKIDSGEEVRCFIIHCCDVNHFDI